MFNEKLNDVEYGEMLTSINSELEEVKNNFTKLTLKKCVVDSNGTKLIFVTFGMCDLTSGDNPHLLNSIFDNDQDILKHFDPECKKFVCYRGSNFDYLLHNIEPLLLKNDINEFYNYKQKSFIERFMNIFNKSSNDWVSKDESINSLFENVRLNLNLPNDEVIFVFTDKK